MKFTEEHFKLLVSLEVKLNLLTLEVKELRAQVMKLCDKIEKQDLEKKVRRSLVDFGFRNWHKVIFIGIPLGAILINFINHIFLFVKR